jgi:hypothetical protein
VVVIRKVKNGLLLNKCVALKYIPHINLHKSYLSKTTSDRTRFNNLLVW